MPLLAIFKHRGEREVFGNIYKKAKDAQARSRINIIEKLLT